MKTAARVLLAVLVLAMAGGCQKKTATSVERGTQPVLYQKGAAPGAAARGAEGTEQAGGGDKNASSLAAMDAGRKLIRNGEISIEVADFETAARKAAEIARSFGGYVADSQSGGEGGGRHGTLTIRVRSGSFEDALHALKALGKVRTEHVATADITKAYTDLETRLRVKREAADRVREILRTRTAKLSDVLEAERQLSNLIEQIETMEGERRFYDQQVALSTIAAELHEPESVARPSAFTPLREAFRDSLHNLSTSLATFVTAILYILPWAILIAFLIAIARRLRRRRRTEPPAK